ncbi:uncharacterized protein KY384_004663 [Bacidia gigantensis]|uniref:uncharacterized protein n=1 Tax=Bacidia gigantensis TaxID=2732470 RepID=UPI001D03BBFE|nr:uncharacterized protein KY384_004663 [Bacidia gigantensis]KAG8530625.1 hypothetical protein KY384_004663 [Bacidia gigantensis]
MFATSDLPSFSSITPQLQALIEIFSVDHVYRSVADHPIFVVKDGQIARLEMATIKERLTANPLLKAGLADNVESLTRHNVLTESIILPTIARPTAFAIPRPRGPVVNSMPSISISGWPWHKLSAPSE